jgi:phage minor structural protein
MLFYLDRHERVQAIYTNNGSPDSCPYYDELLKEDLDTGTSSFEFRVPSNHPKSNEIEEGGYIVRKNLDGELVMFTVIQIEETHSDMSDKYIYAENAGLELLNDIFRPITHMSKNVNQILDIVLADTRWVRGETEYFGIDNFYFDDYQNVLAALQYVTDKFNGELNFRVKMENGEIVARYVDLVEKRGNDTKKRFTYNKDITSIRRKIDMSDVVTALIGVGKGDKNSTPTTFKSVGYYTSDGKSFQKPLNQDWVGDEDARQRYGIKGKHLFGVFQYDTLSPEDLLLRSWSELQKRKTPKITYELDVALLERLANLEHESIRLGDTVYVIDETFSPALYLEARVRQLETCFSDPSRDKCTLGNFKRAKSNITKAMRDLQSKLRQKESTWDDLAYKVQYFMPDGMDFANSTSQKRIIIVVHQGNINVTAKITDDKFIWQKINSDGTHDTVWEEAHVGVGNVISVGVEVAGCTIRCQVDEGLSDPIIFAAEEDATYFCTLPQTNSSGDINRSVAQYAQVDYPRSDIYWSQRYYGSKVPVGEDPYSVESFAITRTGMDGTYKDQMWCIHGGHGASFGIEYLKSKLYIYSCYLDLTNSKWWVVRFPYVAGKILTFEDASVEKLYQTSDYGKGSWRTNLDVKNQYILFTPGAENPAFYVCKKNDVLSGVFKPIYTMFGNDVEFDGTKQTFQSSCLDFPYVYFVSGAADNHDKKILYCVDIRSKALVYKIIYDFNKGTINPPNAKGGYMEPETISYYYDSANKKWLIQGFAFNNADLSITYRTNQLYKISEHTRGET